MKNNKKIYIIFLVNRPYLSGSMKSAEARLTDKAVSLFSTVVQNFVENHDSSTQTIIVFSYKAKKVQHPGVYVVTF